jgi:hypothetical protein
LLYLCLGARAKRFRTNCRSLRNERSKRRGGRQGEAASEEALPVLAAVEDAQEDDVLAVPPIGMRWESSGWKWRPGRIRRAPELTVLLRRGWRIHRGRGYVPNELSSNANLSE